MRLKYRLHFTKDFTAIDYLRHYLTLTSRNTAIGSEAVALEWHHIVPVSLGGTNSASNLVRLTAREHWVAHQLLLKMGFTNQAFAVQALSERLGFKLKRWHRREIAYAQAAAMRNRRRNDIYCSVL